MHAPVWDQRATTVVALGRSSTIGINPSRRRSLRPLLLTVVLLVTAAAIAEAQPRPPLVQAPGYCSSIYTSCNDGCGQYPDRIQDVTLKRAGNAFQLVARVKSYIESPCHACSATFGPLYMSAWVDWNGDHEWQSSERVLRFAGYPGLARACKDTFLVAQTFPIPTGANIVRDTTWMRVTAFDYAADITDPCIQFGRCDSYDYSGAASTLDRRVQLDRPAVSRVEVTKLCTPLFATSDTIWRAPLDTTTCNPGTSSGSGKVAAGFTSGATLRVFISSCTGDTNFVPTTICTYDVDLPGQTITRVADPLKGWSGEIALDLPHMIAKATLRLRYDILDAYGDTLRARQALPPLTLYITYGKGATRIDTVSVRGPSGAGTNTSRPRTVWLDRATEWALGESLKVSIARHMMAGIYNYGPSHWLYRNAQVSANGAWWLMSGLGGSRDTANCFTMSFMWNDLLGALGVDGARPRPYREPFLGWHFLTQKTFVDPFDGVTAPNAGPWLNNDQLARGTPDRWFFTSHQVGRFQGDSASTQYFDPTFNHEFAENNFPGAFAQSATIGETTVDGLRVYVLADTHAVVVLPSREHWNKYSYQPYPNQGPAGPAIPARPARATKVLDDPSVVFQGPYAWSEVDEDADGRSEELVLRGTIRVTGVVTDSLCLTWWGALRSGGATVAGNASFEREGGDEGACVSDSGQIAFALRFDGDDVWSSGLDGPYGATMKLAAGAGGVDSVTLVSPAYTHQSFGRDAARILGVRDSAQDTQGSGLINYIAADVALGTVVATSVTLEAELSIPSSGLRLQTVAKDTTVAAGQSVVRLMLDASELTPYGENGPYGLHVRIVGGRGPRAVLDTLTAAYDAYYIDAPSASVGTGEAFALPVDTDGSGLGDWLQVNLPLYVLEPDEYTIHCELATADTSAPVIATQHLHASLAPGYFTYPIRFDGRQIRASGLNGPYWVRKTVIYRSDGRRASQFDYLLTNQTYAHTVFDSVARPMLRVTSPCVAGTPDTNGNGLYDLVAFTVPIQPDSSGDVQVSGWLASTAGAFEYAETTLTATAGVPVTARLAYSGRSVYGRGEAGPYRLVNFLAYPLRNFLGKPADGEYVPELCATGALGFDAFERAGVVFGLVQTNAGPVAGATVFVDSLPPAEDFGTADAQGKYRAFRRTQGAGTAVVRLQAVSGVADTAWRIYVAGAQVGTGRRIEIPMADTISTRVDFIVGDPVGIGTAEKRPLALRLMPIAPNPVPRGSQVRVAFEVPDVGLWTVKVFDVSGRMVSTWDAKALQPGRVTTTWDTARAPLPTGCYFVSVGQRGHSAWGKSVRKIVVLR